MAIALGAQQLCELTKAAQVFRHGGFRGSLDHRADRAQPEAAASLINVSRRSLVRQSEALPERRRDVDRCRAHASSCLRRLPIASFWRVSTRSSSCSVTFYSGRVSNHGPAITATGSASRRWVRMTTRRSRLGACSTGESSNFDPPVVDAE